MKKKMFSRSLSLMLAVVMLISLLPGIALGATEEIVIQFNKTSGATRTACSADLDGTAAGYTVVAEETNNGNTDVRQYAATTADGSNPKIQQINTNQTLAWQNATTVENARKTKFTFEVAIEEAGWYNLKLQGATWFPGGTFYIYADGQYAGLYVFDNYDTTGKVGIKMSEEKTLNTVYLDPGTDDKVKIMLATAVKNSYGYNPTRALLYTLRLTPVNMNSVAYSRIDSSIPAEIELGDTVSIKANAVMSDGTVLRMNGYSVASDGTAVASDKYSVSVAVKSGETVSLAKTSDDVTYDGVYEGELTATALGETTFTVTAVIDGTPYTKDCTVNVVESVTPKEIELEFSEVTLNNPYGIAPPAWTVTDAANFSIVWDESTTADSSRVQTRVPGLDNKKIFQLATRAYSNLTWIDAKNNTDERAKETDAMFTVETPLYAEGWYNVSMLGGVWYAGSDYYVYVNDTYAGLYSFYDESKDIIAGENKKLNSLYLKPDENQKVKISICVAKTHYDTAYAMLHKIKLTPVSEPVKFEDFVHNIPKEIDVGQSLDVEIKAGMSDGTYRHINGYAHDVTVDDKNSFSVTVKSGESAAFTSTYDSLSSDGVYTGRLVGNATGETVLTATAVIDGQTHTKDITVNVVEPMEPTEFKIDLSGAGLSYTDSKSFFDADANLVITDNAYSIVEEKTTTIAARRTATDSDTKQKINQIQMRSGNYSTWPGSTADANRKNMFTIKKYNPAAGYYNVSMQGYTFYAGGVFAIYVNGEYAGDYSCYRAEKEPLIIRGEKKALNTVYIPKGDVEISFRARKAYYETQNLTPYELTFTPANVTELKYKDITHNIPKKIIIGESADIKAQVVMSDNSIRSFGLANDGTADTDYTVSVVSEAAATAEISDILAVVPETSDVISFKLTGKVIGKTNIIISGKVDGEDFSKTIPVEVVEKPKLKTVKLTLDKDTIPVTRTASSSLVLTREDDSAYPETEKKSIEYSSSDKNVATVDEKGVVTGVGTGTATITAIVTTPEATVDGEANITVTAAPTLASVSMSADSDVMVIGGTKELRVSAVMSDELEGDISKYDITYTSSNEDVATVAEDGTVTAIAVGTAIITAKTKNEGGEDVSARITLTVYDGIPSTIIDFTQTVTELHSVPTETPGYTIIEDGSSDFSKYTYPDVGRSLIHLATRAPGNAMWPKSKNMNNTFGIKVNIPFESDYSVTLIGGANYAGAKYSIFIDGVYIGDHSFYDADYSTFHYGELNTLNTVHLTAGEHEIYFRARESVYDTAYAELDTMKFIPVEGKTELSEISAAIPTELAIGEVWAASASAIMSDGSKYHFGVTDTGEIDTVNTFTASATGSALTLADFAAYEIGNSGNSKFTLTGVEEGKSEITFTATVGGKTVEKKATVNVSYDPITSVSAETEAEELFAGDKTYLIPTAVLKSGRELKSAEIAFESLTPDIAAIEGNLLTALAVGTAEIKVTATFNGDTVDSTFEVKILPEGMTDIKVTAGGSEHIRFTDAADINIEDYIVPLYVQAISNLGNEIDMTGAEITINALTPEYAMLDEVGNIIPVYADPENGSPARFEVTVKTADGRIRTVTKALLVVNAKTKSTYMTAEKAAAARDSIAKYDWAKSSAQNSYIKLADVFVDKVDLLYDMIASNDAPRSTSIGGEGDPDMYYCRYCATDIRLNYGSYAWVHNPFKDPWKVQCPQCKRKFPTNDFESFYKLGLNEYGEFDRQRALEAHAELFGDKSAEPGSDAYYGYGVEGGYLTNELYNDLEKVETLNVNKKLRPGETTATWGVDDGYGYVPKKPDGTPYTYDNDVVERHTYIAEYMHSGVWRKMISGGGVVIEAINRCAYAYFYTGDVKYGRVAAILLDRVADFYPDYDISVFGDNVWNSDGGSNRGKAVGRIWETGTIQTMMTAYDMVYDMYDDPYVLEYISHKASVYKMRHAKNTANQIRTNIEDGIIRVGLEALKTTEIAGNFGYPQIPNARGAVILDSMPETKEWLDYLLAPGWSTAAPCLGGGINEALMNTIDADGQGNEGSTYNVAWHTSLIRVNEALEGYDGYSAANLYNNPKFVQMFYSNLPLISTYYSPNIGDSGSTASKSHWIGSEVAMNGWKNLKDPVFAQVLYMLNGNSADGLHYDMTEADPERLEKEVQAVIDEYGTLELDSEMMTNFGFAILRDGGDYTDATTATAQETRRNVWMYFGTNYGHAHKDTLNLGMTAYGLNFMPELGYPEQTGTQPNRLQWVSSTLSHNTVMVDEKEQKANTEVRGNAMHFDDDGIVQVMDVDANYVYDSTEQYRRSVVMVRVDDEISYTVDFFRVLGGDDHLYSFHASSDEINETIGLELVPQMEDGKYKGSYAGLNVPYGPDPNSPEAWSYETEYPRGYTWLKNIDRAANPEDKFEIDFAIKDFNKAIKDSKGLALHMTMLNGGNMRDGVTAEVSIADGLVPQKVENKNIEKFKYVLVKHTGENLDTTFTTVFEPYRNERYLSSADELEMKVIDGSENVGDAHRAVKVTHKNGGRVDYIFYSTNNSVTYEIVDGDVKLLFSGFVGVYTVKNKVNTYSYVHDGNIIGEATDEKSSIEGMVKTFTKEHSLENEIVITPERAVSNDEITDLANRYVFIDNGDEARSGAFRIYSAERSGDDIVLDVGRVTPIRQYVDSYDESKGYIYTIAEGQDVRIPLTVSDDNAPIFDEVADNLSTSAGSLITVKVNATSPIGSAITYKESMLPRGAVFDKETATLTWRPSDSQVGDNHVAITAYDEYERESTLHFTITVYGSTSGGGGGGGGTTTTTPVVPDDKEDEKPDETTTPDETTKPDEGTTGETEEVRFIDLGNHAWAKDAINSLADEGVIKGTTHNTYSPANNITRADYAVLLVRAFEQTSENTENFDDVLDTDYFAKEIAIARNTGIVEGIGENKFAPRNNITRQDMMVMTYRALVKLGIELEEGKVTAPDMDEVSDYAKEAVTALMSSGLINGKDGYIDPKTNTTRAEVAVLLRRILDYVK